jgi:quercetin dioxygenase-like cupin family protein
MSAMTQEEIRIGALTIRFAIEGEETDGALSLFEFDVPAGAKVPVAHSHDAYDETIYVREGVLTLTVDSTAHDVAAGGAIHVPRGVVHHFDNTTGEDAKALAVVTPGILGPQYFRDVAAVVAAAAGGPPDLAEIGRVMRRHGLTPAP